VNTAFGSSEVAVGVAGAGALHAASSNPKVNNSPRTRIKIEYFLDVFNIAPPLRSSFLSITDKKCRQK
jgi:hypothetical protein